MRTLCLLALLAPCALAQPTSASAVPPVAQVRVATGGDVLVGRFVRAEAGRLVVRTAEAERAVAFDAVTGLWERRPAVGRGAVRGALAGGALVGGGALALNMAWCDTDCDRMANLAAGAATGAVVGALVGAAWGGLRGRWVRRHL